MKTILVTGCAGFIGSHLCESLLDLEYKVIGLDNFDDFYEKEVKKNNLDLFLNHDNFTFHEIDICDFEKLSSLHYNFDGVIHLAAKAGVLPSLKNPQSYIDVNIKGSNNVLEFMKVKGIDKYLFASSSSVYGNNKEVPFDETQIVDFPISPYAFTKRSCELMNYNYFKLYNINTINLRFFTVYGPRQRPDQAIHKFLKLIKNNQAIEMYGDGSSARDYTYVKDIVYGINAALNFIFEHQDVFEFINLGSSNPISLKNLISTIYNVEGQEENVIVKKMHAGDVDITYANISKAQQLLGYQPKTSLKDGVLKFKQWYDQQG